LPSSVLAEGQDAVRACVVVHVDAAALAGEAGGGAQLEGDHPVASVCGHCHKLVHELGWTVSGNANGVLTFRRPDGRVLTTGPPGLRPDVREDIDRAIGRAS
jgi:hypothetical protein